jgi:hypothetical protein
MKTTIKKNRKREKKKKESNMTSCASLCRRGGVECMIHGNRWLRLTGSEVQAELKAMSNISSTSTKKPQIELFSVTETAATIPERVECAPCTEKLSNCANIKDFVPGGEAPSGLATIGLDKALYGKYTLDPEDCTDIRVGADTRYSPCRLVNVQDIQGEAGVAWKTTWKNGSNTISVTHTAGNLASQLGSEDNDDDFSGEKGFKAFFDYDKPKIGFVTRAALNVMRVFEMKLEDSKKTWTWTLCGAHRLNFNYTEDVGKWWDGFLSKDKLTLMKQKGLATRALYDPLGLTWLLLWCDGTGKYAVCAAYMHPHFADLLTGNLPQNYNICTAIRWQNNTPVEQWFYAGGDGDPAPGGTDFVKAQMGTTTWWTADKIRKPFFTIDTTTGISASAYADDAAKKHPEIKKLLNDLSLVYFSSDLYLPDVTNTASPVPVPANTPVSDMLKTPTFSGPASGPPPAAGPPPPPPAGPPPAAGPPPPAGPTTGPATTGKGTGTAPGTDAPAEDVDFFGRVDLAGIPNWAWFVIVGGVLLIIIFIAVFVRVMKARSSYMEGMAAELDRPQGEVLTDQSAYNQQDPYLSEYEPGTGDPQGSYDEY